MTSHLPLLWAAANHTAADTATVADIAASANTAADTAAPEVATAAKTHFNNHSTHHKLPIVAAQIFHTVPPCQNLTEAVWVQKASLRRRGNHKHFSIDGSMNCLLIHMQTTCTLNRDSNMEGKYFYSFTISH